MRDENPVSNQCDVRAVSSTQGQSTRPNNLREDLAAERGNLIRRLAEVEETILILTRNPSLDSLLRKVRGY